MFSNPTVRLITAILVIGAAVVFALGQMWIATVVAFIVGGILLFMHFRLGPVFVALQALYRGNMSRAEDQLRKVKDPSKLPSGHRGYYHFVKAYLAMQQNRRDQAKEQFRLALDAGLKLNNDKAVAHISLADLYLVENNRKDAKRHLEIAQSYKHNQAVAKAIEEVKKRLRA